MAESPLVSIVTPSFNQAAFLKEATNSVFSQEFSPIEYIVIDGGSTDGSVELLKKTSSKLTYWISEPDKGQADAINKGFARATGKYFAWLNADDRLKPNAVKEAVAFLEAHPKVGMVYGDADFIDAEGRVVGRFDSQPTDYKKLLRGYVHIPQQAAFWRADLWRRVAPLDINLMFAMDYDLWVRLAKISRLHYEPRLWADFRLHLDSKTIQNDMRAWDDMLKVHRREGGSAISIITAKYWLRRVLFPFIRAKRMLMVQTN
jgi:glycosyltransferase involved in cell wall biosynthesis